MHNFRQVASLLSQTFYGTAAGKGKYGVYLRGLLECRENNFLMCLKSGNPGEKEVSGRRRRESGWRSQGIDRYAISLIGSLNLQT